MIRSRPCIRRDISPRAAVAVVALLGLVAAACGDPPTAGNNDDEAADGDLPECDVAAFEDAVAEGPVQIDLWYGGLVGASNQAMVNVAEDFNQQQDEVVLTIHNQGEAYEEVFRSFESAAAAGAGQLPDIVYLSAEDFAATVDSGRIMPAEACMEATDFDVTTMAEIARAYYTLDGTLYAGYMNISNPVLYYNRNHWERAGLDPDDPPATLEEVHDHARAIQNAGVADTPLVLKLDRWPFAAWLNGIGIHVVDNDNGRSGPPSEATFDTDETRDLIERFQAMDDEGLIRAVPNEEGSIDQYIPLATQDASMLVETSTAATTIRETLAGDLTAEDLGVGADIDLEEDILPMAAQFPGIEAPGQIYPTGGAFYMLNTSDPVEQVAAWKFMEFMLQPENAAEWLTTGGYVPTVTAVLEDPETQDYLETDLAGLMTAEAVEQMQAADTENPGPVMGPYIDFSNEFESVLESVFLADGDVDSALETAEENVTAALERYYG
jgi:sn-glycerol 3-phosphate transport system substrate-binding protein